ncbi:FkbM family methyltransferase, partial [Hydrotalea sp.]|uniref:FkbM family methyltransferase n=1 Tax=Hydrotalea sp. TaxID=2881279 RepID=UPI003D111144
MKHSIFYKIRLKFIYLSTQKMNVALVGGHYLEIHSINKNDFVFDLGGNLGNFSSAILDQFGCTCYIVEPNPVLFSQLPKHKNLIPLNYAITDKEGDIAFEISENNEASSVFLSIASKWNYQKTITVRSKTLNNLMIELKIPAIDILKIDIEGAELVLFKSLSDTDITQIKQISVEFHESFDISLAKDTYKTVRRIAR